MKYSLNQLRKMAHIPLITKDEVILEAINNLGFEIENVENFATATKLLIGKILKINKHPNADRLVVTEVSIGSKTLQIITAAKNIAIHKYVIVFVEGSTLHGKEFHASDLRGVKSEGMFASLSELGVSKSVIPSYFQEGVLILDDGYKYKLGADALQEIGLQDKIIEIDILSNRADARSYFVLATELSAYFATKPDLIYHEVESDFKTTITATKGLAKEFTIFEAKALLGYSSLENQLLLMKSEILPINKTVDLTNLALILFGQAVHAYDKDKIGKHLTVGYHSGEVHSINNEEIHLQANLTVFADKKPVSVAGVIGLYESRITDQTEHVVFEIANFATSDIRKTIAKTKIMNATANRNSNESSVNMIMQTIFFLQNNLDFFSNVVGMPKLIVKEIDVHPEIVESYAGFEITKDKNYKKALEMMKGLGYKIHEETFVVPYYRYDINNVYDIIEDIFRMFGYNNIPDLQPTLIASLISKNSSLKTEIAAKGYSEIITYSLQDEHYNDFNPFNLSKDISLQSFASENRRYYRQSIVKSMVEVGINNTKQKLEKFSFFEVGFLNGNHQHENLAIISSIKTFEQIREDLYSILVIEGDVEFVRTSNDILLKNVSADIYVNGKYRGYIGKFNPNHLNVDFWIAEITITKYNNLHQDFKEINKQQLCKRDITFDLKLNEDVQIHIKNLRSKVDAVYFEFKNEYVSGQKRALTFTLYLSEQEAKVFDEIFNK